MDILRGAPALSEFRTEKLLQRLQQAELPITAVYAEFIHFAAYYELKGKREREEMDKAKRRS